MILPLILVVLAIAILAWIEAGIVLSLVALIVLMVLPGLGLAKRLVPGQRLGTAPSIVTSVGLGIALTILIGIGLDQTPIGVARTPVVMVVLAVASVAILGRGRGRLRNPVAAPSFSVGQATMLAASLVVAVGAFGLSRVSLTSGAPADVTQLWLVPFPDGALEAGVANYGSGRQSYRLVLRSGGRGVKEWQVLDLQPGQTWRDVVSAATPLTLPLVGVLYRSDQPDLPIREVSISRKGP